MPDPEIRPHTSPDSPTKDETLQVPDRLRFLMLTMPKFNLGQTVITATAKAVLSPEDVRIALLRHSRGDWGDLCSDDRKVNERGVLDRGMILSSYQSADGVKFWVITDPGHDCTTVLLPEDY